MDTPKSVSLNLVEITWKRALMVWWSIAWRAVFYGMFAGFVIGFIAGFVFSIINIPPGYRNNIYRLLGLLVSIPMQIGIIKYVLSKEYSDFKIALIAKDTNQTKETS